jgi:hypothetical protein
MAILNASSDSKKNNLNLLLKRYTLQIENLSDETDRLNDDMEWELRDTLLNCLYSKDFAQNWPS